MDLSGLERLMRSGKTLEEVAEKTSWQDFEDLCDSILEEHNFDTRKRFRFKDASGQGHEIDILATKNLVKKHGRGARRTAGGLAVDCKHWACGRTSAVRNAAKKQAERVKALKGLREFKGKPIVSVVVTLFQENIIQEGEVWIVPVFKLNSFLISH